MRTLEILTKEKLPKELKEGLLKVNIHEKWSDSQIKLWAEDQYWFETFPFSPKKRADSPYVWDVINKIDWSGQSVLDIGCHYGYFSFKASESGARVTGFEPNGKTLEVTQIIQRNIWHQDIKFVKKMPFKLQKFDVILYLSVHHQPDPSYAGLEKKIIELKEMTDKHLFIELIMPPVFPRDSGLSETDIDKIVGGIILVRYKHAVRGNRKIYWIKK